MTMTRISRSGNSAGGGGNFGAISGDRTDCNVLQNGDRTRQVRSMGRERVGVTGSAEECEIGKLEWESATPERQQSGPRAPMVVPQTPAVTPGPDAVREVPATGPRVGRSERLAPPNWEAHHWPKVEPVDAPIPGGSGAPMRSIVGARQVAQELFPGAPERGTSTRANSGVAGSTEGGAGAPPAELKAEPMEGKIPGGNANIPLFDLEAEQEVVAGEMKLVYVLDGNDQVNMKERIWSRGERSELHQNVPKTGS
ncbi:hypothetical protein C8F04DRAFT_1202000 [Mycena alexandri]|uniref:Uncharacterized protein n=1 Tax=Mycena alexandri TaxID=1745969 RepID=A0AAD6RXT1_9AGAR|nr:hypothetical protein C8F04DRAFT_1202000 [Mycena alexandri]